MMELFLDNMHLSLWPYALAILTIVLLGLWRRGHSLSYLVCCAVFGVYLLFALDKVFFPLPLSYADFSRPLSEMRWSFINLIPFNFNLSELRHLVIFQIYLNILLTVPFGFGINFIANLRPKTFLWLAPAVGLGIETTQLLLGVLLRLTYRTVDINDVLLNALGVLIGYSLFRVFAWLYLGIIDRLGVKTGGMVAYVYVVASRAHRPPQMLKSAASPIGTFSHPEA